MKDKYLSEFLNLQYILSGILFLCLIQFITSIFLAGIILKDSYLILMLSVIMVGGFISNYTHKWVEAYTELQQKLKGGKKKTEK